MSDKTPKLHVLLALREKGEITFKNAVADLAGKFKNKQGIFKGVRKTYVPTEGYADDPSKRGYINVASTITEQFDYFLKVNSEHMKNLFSVEKTNASGTAVAELAVNGEVIGTYTSLELLRLKSMLEDQKLKGMIENIPVRSEEINWKESGEDLYKDLEVYENEKDAYEARTTVKETYIVTDPHIKDSPSRPPIVAEKSPVVVTGKGTTQFFTGEYSVRERAYMIKRLNDLHVAVTEALEEANAVESVESDLGEKAINFLFKK